MRRADFATLLLPAIVLAGCGARSSLVGEAGAGAAGGATSSSTSASSSTAAGGGGPLCAAWQLVSPITELKTAAPDVHAPELSLADDGDVILSAIEAPPGAPGVLRTGRLAAFSHWPADFTQLVASAPSVRDYVTGAGATGPVALIAPATGPLELATAFYPQLDAMPQATPGNAPVFATGIADRLLFGASQALSTATKLTPGSYQTGSLEQGEAPVACLTSSALAAAVPAGQGFVAAYALPNPPLDSCGSGAKPGTVVTFYRYDAPSAPGSFIAASEGDHLVGPDPIAALVLTRTSDGAWSFHHTDGSTSFTSPGILAVRIDERGHITPVDASAFQAAPDGVVNGPIAASSLGDGAVLAWVDALDPSSATVSLRTIGADGALGPITTFATGALHPSGRLRVITARSLRSALVAWDSQAASAEIGLARLDCAPAL